MSAPRSAAPRIAVVVKGYPRLSETFIAQELLALEAHGLDLGSGPSAGLPTGRATRCTRGSPRR